MKDRESLFGRAEQHFRGTADELYNQVRKQEGIKKLLSGANASLHREIARGIVRPLRQVEEKLRGIKPKHK